MSLLHHTTDEDIVFQKMRETFCYRQQILHDPLESTNILQMFPRFLDTKGLILQDFAMMFGPDTASRFLEKWNTSFKDKVAREARDLKETYLLKRLLKSALSEEMDVTDKPEWDPRPKKISVGEAIDHLVKFHMTCQRLEDHLMSNEGNPQPYLLATGTSKAQVLCSQMEFSWYMTYMKT
ncbi:uncharacterized protein LOC143478262 [Brachyhypopomus gauderio]|uniref:uncharacterized protein LOC143478262 n=1 Tax=Brachyhypopomus gauderio TaxID=698409 RepID=UPI0040417625